MSVWVSVILLGFVFLLMIGLWKFPYAALHSYNCLCERCKKGYLKERWEKLERERKDQEWMEWRRTVDQHFKEIEQKSFR